MIWMFLACGLLETAPTELTVSVSEPESAYVFDGDERLGETPWVVPVADAPDKVTLRANGFTASEVVLSADRAEVDVALQPGCERLVDYDGRFAEQRRLKPGEVARIPPKRLAFVRNEIFAQYGRAFDNERYREHFAKADWYEVNKHFEISVLSAVDKQNAALIKSFEGDTAGKLLERGQFEGEGMVLALVDLEHAEVADTGGDLYEWDRKERRWTARGDWVITWDTPERFGPNATKARLWKLDRENGKVLETMPLQPNRG